MSLKLTNEAQFRQAIAAEYAALALDSEEQVADLARGMSEGMRKAAPVMDETERAERRKGGSMSVRRTPGKSTIRFSRGRDREGFYCDVGPGKGAFYLAFIEWGTSKLKARPFLRPAIEAAIAAWGK